MLTSLGRVAHRGLALVLAGILVWGLLVLLLFAGGGGLPASITRQVSQLLSAALDGDGGGGNVASPAFMWACSIVSPLHLLVLLSKEGAVHALLPWFGVHATNLCGSTPLHVSSRMGASWTTSILLVTHKADLHGLDGLGRSPLELARLAYAPAGSASAMMQSGPHRTVAKLVCCGACAQRKPDQHSSSNTTACSLADAMALFELEIVEMLDQRGAKSKKDLCWASASERLALYELLLREALEEEAAGAAAIETDAETDAGNTQKAASDATWLQNLEGIDLMTPAAGLGPHPYLPAAYPAAPSEEGTAASRPAQWKAAAAATNTTNDAVDHPLMPDLHLRRMKLALAAGGTTSVPSASVGRSYLFHTLLGVVAMEEEHNHQQQLARGDTNADPNTSTDNQAAKQVADSTNWADFGVKHLKASFARSPVHDLIERHRDMLIRAASSAHQSLVLAGHRVKIIQLHDTEPIFLLRGLLTEDESRAISQIDERLWVKSGVGGDANKEGAVDKAIRDSQTAWLQFEDRSDVLAALSDRVVHLSGLPAFYQDTVRGVGAAISCFYETFSIASSLTRCRHVVIVCSPPRLTCSSFSFFVQPQAVRYPEGGYYNSHLDVDELRSPTYYPLRGAYLTGNRVMTVLTYLNTLKPEEGGGTHFQHLNVTVYPRRGDACLFYTSNRDGTPRKETRHASLPVKPAANVPTTTTASTTNQSTDVVYRKWVVNKWVRDIRRWGLSWV